MLNLIKLSANLKAGGAVDRISAVRLISACQQWPYIYEAMRLVALPLTKLNLIRSLD